MKLSPIHVASLLLLGMLSPVCRPQDKPKPEDKPKSEVSTTPVKVTPMGSATRAGTQRLLKSSTLTPHSPAR